MECINSSLVRWVVFIITEFFNKIILSLFNKSILSLQYEKPPGIVPVTYLNQLASKQLIHGFSHELCWMDLFSKPTKLLS